MIRTSTLSDRLARAASSGAVVWLVVAVLAVVALSFADGFGTPNNLNNVARQGAALALVALAQFLVVLIGHVDLSIAANAKLAAIVAAVVMDGSDAGLFAGIAVALLTGLVVGAVNTVLVVYLGVESFIATLATGTVLQGVVLFIAPTPTGKASPGLTGFYNATAVGGVYLIVLLVALLWLAAWFLLRKTVWGVRVYAVGGDPVVAAVSGVRVRPVQASSFLASGILGGVAGLVFLGSAGVGDPNAASGLEFTALAIVVIGGASLAGGKGRLIGLLGGVVLFALLGNVFNLLRVEVWYQQLLRGLIILFAAALFVKKVAKPRRMRSPKVPHGASATG
jgi:ribose transport system permease protein